MNKDFEAEAIMLFESVILLWDSYCDEMNNLEQYADPRSFLKHEKLKPALAQLNKLFTEARIDELEKIANEPRRTADTFDGKVYVYKMLRVDDRIESLKKQLKGE